jgi:hypothetical protein
VSPAILDASAPRAFTEIIPANNLAVCTEKLADLRFLIILTARWESSDSVDREQRDLMRQDLVRLRKQYSDQIDVIAMSFGVQDAIGAKEDVERQVQVPAGTQPPTMLQAPQDDGPCL